MVYVLTLCHHVMCYMVTLRYPYIFMGTMCLHMLYVYIELLYACYVLHGYIVPSIVYVLTFCHHVMCYMVTLRYPDILWEQCVSACYMFTLSHYMHVMCYIDPSIH